jgi:SPP1 gp7 family putative phage head morphogenesis protein
LKSLSATETPPSKERLEEPYLPEIDPGLVGETETLVAAALLMGMDHARNKLDMADGEIPALPFEEAVAFMKSRIPLTKAEWNALEPKLRFRAFTVARQAQCDYIDAARQVLTKALETGKGTAETYKQWQTIQTLVQDDAMRLRPGYWENVFRTNTQTAYVAGKLMQFQNNPPPAWRLLVIDDSRTSDICRGLIRDGKGDLVIASDHPFWKTFGFPPYHYQCRTGIQAVYTSQINHGTRVENPAMESLRERFTPMKGFGGNPLDKESWWQMTDGMIKRAGEYGIDGDMVVFAHILGMKNYALNLVKDYKTLFAFNNGGYVKAAALARPGAKNKNAKDRWVETDETGAAEKAAQAGHQIFFLPKTKVQGINNLNVMIDNELGDIKHIFTATKTAVDTALKGAKEQGAHTVLLEIVTPDLQWEVIEKAVKNRLGSRIKKALVYWNGKLHTILK